MLLEEAVSLIHRFSFATYVAQHILFSSSFLLLFVFQNRQNILSSLNNPTLPSCEDFSSTLLVYLNCLKKSPREMFALQRHNALCIVLILLCLVFVHLCIYVFVYLCIYVFMYLCIFVFVYLYLSICFAVSDSISVRIVPILLRLVPHCLSDVLHLCEQIVLALYCCH